MSDMLHLMRYRSERWLKSPAMAPSPRSAGDSDKPLSATQDLLRRFNPRLVGFGIVDPRDGGDLLAPARKNVVVKGALAERKDANEIFKS
jgi:hypothetical protein